jgi:hypothetical protein
MTLFVVSPAALFAATVRARFDTMRPLRQFTTVATLCALLSVPLSASGETFDLVFYGIRGTQPQLQRLSQYTLMFTGTFTIADAALGRPGALILYRDGAFLGFDVTIETPVRSYNFNLADPNDIFPGDPYQGRATGDPLQGLRLDAAGRPARFDTPITAAGNSASIREHTPSFTTGGPRPFLNLYDSDDFDVVIREDGVLVTNGRGRVAGTRVAGWWSFGGHASTDHTSLAGIYLIRSRGTTTPPPTLSSPTNFSAQVSGLSVLLSWQPSSGASSYVLEAGTSSGSTNVFVGDVGNTTTLGAQGPAGTFFARVRARNASGTSGPSNEVSFTLGASSPCGVAPGAPSGLASSRLGTLLRLSWNQAAAATSYQLEAGTAPGASNVFSGDLGSSTSQQFDISGIAAGSYFVRVRAKNGCGTSGPSSEIVVTIP